MYIVQPVKCSPASISCKLASLSLTCSKRELCPLSPSSSRITHPFRRKAYCNCQSAYQGKEVKQSLSYSY